MLQTIAEPKQFVTIQQAVTAVQWFPCDKCIKKQLRWCHCETNIDRVSMHVWNRDLSCSKCKRPLREHGYILPIIGGKNLGEGGSFCPGTWIATYADGDFAAFSPKAFAERFEEV